MRKQSDSEALEQLYDLYEQKMYAVPIQIIIISLQQLEEEKALSVTWDTWSMKICLARFIWIQIIVMK